jgi:hypothetical protein
VSSYQVPQLVGPAARPGTVTAAAALGYVAVVLLVGIGVMTAVLIANSVSVTFTSPSLLASTGDVAPLISGIVYGVGLGLVATAQWILTIFLLRGTSPARILVWILDWLLIMWAGCFGVSSSINGLADGLNTSSNSVDPIHYDPLSLVGLVEVIAVALLVLVLIPRAVLLALPRSGQFFRQADQVWVPTDLGLAGRPPFPIPPAPPESPWPM